jgi:cytochrome c-type biogenesis protein CcmH
MMKRIFPLLLLLLLLLMVPAASAQEGPTQDEVNAVARKLFCPVCENTPLDVCPTEACQQWRDVIRTKLMEGQSEEEILDYFATMYGDSVLAQPPPRQLAAWLLPVVIVVAAVAALAYWLRSWTRPEVTAAPVTPEEVIEESDPYVERLERELSEWA